VAFVPGGESLKTAAVNTMALSFTAMTFNAHNEWLFECKARSSSAAGTVSADQFLSLSKFIKHP